MKMQIIQTIRFKPSKSSKIFLKLRYSFLISSYDFYSYMTILPPFASFLIKTYSHRELINTCSRSPSVKIKRKERRKTERQMDQQRESPRQGSASVRSRPSSSWLWLKRRLSSVNRPSLLPTKPNHCQTSKAFKCNVARVRSKQWLH